MVAAVHTRCALCAQAQRNLPGIAATCAAPEPPTSASSATAPTTSCKAAVRAASSFRDCIDLRGHMLTVPDLSAVWLAQTAARWLSDASSEPGTQVHVPAPTRVYVLHSSYCSCCVGPAKSTGFCDGACCSGSCQPDYTASKTFCCTTSIPLVPAVTPYKALAGRRQRTIAHTCGHRQSVRQHVPAGLPSLAAAMRNRFGCRCRPKRLLRALQRHVLPRSHRCLRLQRSLRQFRANLLCARVPACSCCLPAQQVNGSLACSVCCMSCRLDLHSRCLVPAQGRRSLLQCKSRVQNVCKAPARLLLGCRSYRQHGLLQWSVLLGPMPARLHH